MIRWIKGLVISAFFKFIERTKEYDVQRIRALVTFTNGVQCEVAIFGTVEIGSESMNNSGTYILDYNVTKAKDVFHEYLLNLDASRLDFIVGTNQVYYKLSEHKVDNIKILETASHIVRKTVYDRVRK